MRITWLRPNLVSGVSASWWLRSPLPSKTSPGSLWLAPNTHCLGEYPLRLRSWFFASETAAAASPTSLATMCHCAVALRHAILPMSLARSAPDMCVEHIHPLQELVLEGRVEVGQYMLWCPSPAHPAVDKGPGGVPRFGAADRQDNLVSRGEVDHVQCGQLRALGLGRLAISRRWPPPR